MFSLKLSTILVIISAWFTLENDAQAVFSAEQTGGVGNFEKDES